MNEHIDPAFAPMDKPDASVGRHADGSVTYKVVEGNTYLDGKLVKPEQVGLVAIDHPEGEGH